MAKLHIVQETDPLPSMPEEPALRTPYLPDRFQRFAIQAIEQGDNVLITAKTGSGKTFVGEYQIAKSLSRGGRIFYTTPVKSLSNQKFHDLKMLFPDASVGIMTGDIKFRPDAQVIVMTTEILRNLLYKRGTATEKVGTTSLLSLEGLDAVVFDEVHYINDKDRGHVWEETLMLLPPAVKLVLLSATLTNPQLFARWLTDVKGVSLWLISTLWRAVPLEHCVIDGKGEFITMYTAKEVFDNETYRAWLAERKGTALAHDRFQEKVRAERRAGHEGPVAGKVRPKAFEHQLNECLDKLFHKGSLPAIIFQFSRQGCERLAAKTQGIFLDTNDQAVVRHIWNFHLSRFSKTLEHSPQYHTLYELAQRGIAFHHSGLLPFLKEILEILFNKGLIKVLFATETFAVGINMPTKTVIFTALEKFTDSSIRPLTTAEYIQMAGRAGRRGKDDRGLVLYLPQREPLELHEIRPMLTGQASSFQSRLGFHYDFVLKILNSKQTAEDLVKKSYWWALEEEGHRQRARELEALRGRLVSQALPEAQRIACEARYEQETVVGTTQGTKKKTAQRILDRWKEDHAGTLWESAYKKFLDNLAVEADIHRLDNICAQHALHLPDVPRRLRVLEGFGYVTSNGPYDADGTHECAPSQSPEHQTADAASQVYVLTQRGQMASEVNEGHPFLMTELFLRLSQPSALPLASVSASSSAEAATDKSLLLTLLAVFLGEAREGEEGNCSPDDLAVPACVKEELWRMDEDARKWQKAESQAGLAPDVDFWALSTEWIEPIWQWITEPEQTIGSIAATFGIFEGNLQKALLKLMGLVEELQALASLTGAVEMLRVLEDCRPLVLRDVVVAESLYLRL